MGRRRNLNPLGESNPRPSDPALRCSTTDSPQRLYGERDLLRSLYDTLIYKHAAIDIADSGSMQDACHMKFVTDLAQRRVSVAQW